MDTHDATALKPCADCSDPGSCQAQDECTESAAELLYLAQLEPEPEDSE